MKNRCQQEDEQQERDREFTEWFNKRMEVRSALTPHVKKIMEGDPRQWLINRGWRPVQKDRHAIYSEDIPDECDLRAPYYNIAYYTSYEDAVWLELEADEYARRIGAVRLVPG